MGHDKAALFAAAIVERLQEISDDVFVVAKSAVDGCTTVIDATDESTPLVGVLTAMGHARHEALFVCACDMPLVDPELVSSLAERLGPHGAIVPVRDGQIEPLHAVWSVAALDAVERAFASGERAVHRVIEALDHVRVDVPMDHPSFTNVNTPDDLQALPAFSRTAADSDSSDAPRPTASPSA